MNAASPSFCGAVAQLGERLVRNEEATGSIPVSSTKTAVIHLVVMRAAILGGLRFWVTSVTAGPRATP